MRAPSIDAPLILVALEKRDPETLVGPVLCLLTWIARDAAGPGALAAGCTPSRLGEALVAHLVALAAHPAVSLELRLAAGALAIEHRDSGAMTAPTR